MKARLAIVTTGMVIGMAGTAFAGQWQQDSIRDISARKGTMQVQIC